MAAGDSHSGIRIPTRVGTRVSGAALIDTWTSHPWTDGIRVDRLLAHDRITVRTRHSVYEVVVLTPTTADVLVRGGAFFTDWTPARVAGSSLGGSFLKLHAIYVGFRMEIIDGRRSIVTSTVQTVSLVRGAGRSTVQ